MSEKDLMQVCGGCGLMLPIPSDHSCLTENAGIPGGTKVLMRPNTDAAEALWTKLGKPAWKLGLIADKVAAIEKAAEERGRRRGVEACVTFLGNAGAFDLAHQLAVRHLAPRDSGKEGQR